MAANFWKSTQCNQWLLEDQSVVISARESAATVEGEGAPWLTANEQVQLDLFYVEVIHALGKQLGGSKQQVIATACVYMKRFCHVNSWCSVEPFLTALTCVYLATKVEEFGPISVKKILTAATRVVRKEAFEGLLPTRRGAQGLECLYVHADVIECEFVLVEEMGCCLVVFQPYRCLLSYASDAQVEKTLLPMAWNIVNDSLRSTACLTSPPYMIALTALHMASAILGQDLAQWFAKLNINTVELMEITQILLNTYNAIKKFDKSKVGPILDKVKAKAKQLEDAMPSPKA